MGFVADPRQRQHLWQAYRAQVVDMESAAIAREAQAAGLPFLVVRGVSDLAGADQDPNQIAVYYQLAADNAGRVILAIIEDYNSTYWLTSR